MIFFIWHQKQSNKSKNKQMGQHQIKKLLYSKRNHQQNEQAIHWMGKSICKSYIYKGSISELYKNSYNSVAKIQAIQLKNEQSIWANIFFFFLFFFFCHACSMLRFPDQGLNPSHSSNNAKPLNASSPENSTFSQRCTDSQQVHEKVINITKNQGTANQNHNETPPPAC